ncbi:MAG: hypothetical protein WD595_05550 [Waddliaceae bacterium]
MKKRWILILSITVVIALMGSNAFFFSKTKQIHVKPLSNVTNILTDHLRDIQENKLIDSYENYTSAPFQQTTPLEKYLRFILSHPKIFRFDSVTLSEPKQKAERQIITAALEHENSHTQLLEYSLIDEDGEWRIISMHILPDHSSDTEISYNDAETNPQIKPEIIFNQLIIGSEIDGKGEVIDPKQNFNPDAKLFFSIQVLEGIAGTDINLQLSHHKTGFTTPRISTVLPKNGDATITFAFSPPVNGWPYGKFIAKVSTNSTFIEKEFWIVQNSD